MSRRPVAGPLLPLLPLLVLALVAAGCSSDEPAESSGSSASPHGGSTATSGASADPPSWNPCDDLTPAEVGRLLGEEVTEETGDPGAMRCTYVPVAEGGPMLDLNYLWFDGSFEDAWDTIGEVAGDVQDLDLPSADAARTVTQVTDDAVAVTGFVQTRGLIESVNAIALDPADRTRLVRATRGVLARLSERAPERAAD
ncbi:DUF3558 family protein [Nocardioides sp. NPDC092400]|uniref:DUF3558 family protein n=1 Tax=Nocardioides sp. NPDC092400 TaxID=3155196 RepID=UPI00342C3926